MSETKEHPIFSSYRGTTPKDKAVINIFERASQIIGNVLALASLTEFSIGAIISDYFSESVEKRDLMFSLLIGGNLSLASQRRILMHILSDNKFKDIQTEYPDLEDRLAKLTEFRNRCAHSFPDTSDEFLERKYEGISFVWYDNGVKKHQDVTYAEAQNRIGEYAQAFLDTATIRQKIGRFPPL